MQQIASMASTTRIFKTGHQSVNTCSRFPCFPISLRLQDQVAPPIPTTETATIFHIPKLNASLKRNLQEWFSIESFENQRQTTKWFIEIQRDDISWSLRTIKGLDFYQWPSASYIGDIMNQCQQYTNKYSLFYRGGGRRQEEDEEQNQAAIIISEDVLLLVVY